MKRIFSLILLLGTLAAQAAEVSVKSPDGGLALSVNESDGRLTYSITYRGRQVLLPSSLGIVANFADFSTGLKITGSKTTEVRKTYQMKQVKQSDIRFNANALQVDLENAKGQRFSVEFQVADNDVAFRYLVPRQRNNNPKAAVIERELSSFRFPQGTTTFISPQSNPMIGWERTKPSYEEGYTPDAPLSARSFYGQGYTFPCLFHLPADAITDEAAHLAACLDELTTHRGDLGSQPANPAEAIGKLASKPGKPADGISSLVGKNGKPIDGISNLVGKNGKPADAFVDNGGGWVLVSETGVSSNYCGSHLSDYDPQAGYTIQFPMPGENNGVGGTQPGLSLPSATPWRTITVGASLAPIVETTVAYDVVDPLYLASENFKFGRYTWSWLIWQDNSINYADQVKFIDVAARLGYEYCLVDASWDVTIGRERMAELSAYAQSKGVRLLLWYNSNGYANDAPQTPRGIMNNAIARDADMAWMRSIGIGGIKVDFFGGDKQETMKLYEDILFDANRYGLLCIFHGCTLPRGWERMYPNYVSSEAVLASENIFFNEGAAVKEAFDLCLHPYCRNAFAAMDFGGVIMNRYLAKDNASRHSRKTTNVFELATGITNQSALQCVAVQPNNFDELNDTELDYLRSLPVTWDETRYIAGYPGRYVVMARRQGSRWYIAGLNATKSTLTLDLALSMFRPDEVVNLISDVADRTGKGDFKTVQSAPKLDKRGCLRVTLQPNGGVVAYK